MRNSKSEKELHMQLWRESGLSKVEYATQSGLKPYSFYTWFKQTKSDPQSATEFVEIPKKKNPSKEKITTIKISLTNGYEITVDPGLDRDNLCAILDLLESR